MGQEKVERPRTHRAVDEQAKETG